MKEMRKIIAIAVALSLAASASAQKIGVLNGPSGIPCAPLMEKASEGTVPFEFEVFASAQTELPKLLKGEIDVGFLPPNVAAKVYNTSKNSLVCLGITGNGNIFLMTKDESVSSFRDLDGKTISCAGQGATPEYVAKFLMKKNSVSANLDFTTPNPEIAGVLIAGKFDYALVPEPFATVIETKDGSFRRAINISDEFKSAVKSDFPMTLLVANASYTKKHKKEIAKVIEEFRNALQWSNDNTSEAGALVEKHSLGLKATVAAKAIPNAVLTWKTAKDGRADIEKILSVFLENAPESVGGKLPDKKFYY